MVAVMTACKQSGFRVEGVAEGFSEGDTLYFYEEVGQETPADTLVVKDGKFTLQGETDPENLSSVVAADGSAGATFFREEGSISLVLTKDGLPKVGGTKANDAWQKVNDIQEEYEAKFGEMLTPFYSGEEVDDEQRQKMLADFQTLEAEMMSRLADVAEENIDNAVGLFLVLSFGDNQKIEPERLKGMIDKMPQAFRQREEIVELQETLENAENTAEGKTMPDFMLPTPDGQLMSAMDEVAKHKVTILDFWASWCGPCCQEMPNMVSLYAKYREKGLGILGISLDNDKDKWKGAIASMNMTWPQVGDMNGWNTQPVELFQVTAIPFVAVVDASGTILAKGLRGAELEAFIEKTLK